MLREWGVYEQNRMLRAYLVIACFSLVVVSALLVIKEQEYHGFRVQDRQGKLVCESAGSEGRDTR